LNHVRRIDSLKTTDTLPLLPVLRVPERLF
jgi:hypothetical protein